MQYPSGEDRLNPLTPEGVDDTTLGGYPAVHGRAAGFEGSDGQPYTAAIEVEAPERGGESWGAYLVFLRWAQTGSSIMGHLETSNLAEGATELEVRSALEALPLMAVKEILDQQILLKLADEEEAG